MARRLFLPSPSIYLKQQRQGDKFKIVFLKQIKKTVNFFDHHMRDTQWDYEGSADIQKRQKKLIFSRLAIRGVSFIVIPWGMEKEN